MAGWVVGRARDQGAVVGSGGGQRHQCNDRMQQPAAEQPNSWPSHLRANSTPTVPSASSSARRPRSLAVFANTKARMLSRSRLSSCVSWEELWRSKNSTLWASRERKASTRRAACSFSPALQAFRMYTCEGWRVCTARLLSKAAIWSKQLSGYRRISSACCIPAHAVAISSLPTGEHCWPRTPGTAAALRHK